MEAEAGPVRTSAGLGQVSPGKGQQRLRRQPTGETDRKGEGEGAGQRRDKGSAGGMAGGRRKS